MRLKGKVALVTGGATRIGRAVALALGTRGARVALTYRRSCREARATVRRLERDGAGLAVQVDQRDPESVRRGVREVMDRFGRVDVLVNNASSFYPTPWRAVTEGQWRDLIDANLSGPWWFCQAVASGMKRRGAGKIVNITDVSVLAPWTDYLPYSAAKGGLVTLTLGLARALAPKVQVNAIAPGPILFPPGTPVRERRAAVARTLLRRRGNPQDIVQAVLFLTQGTDFVTGTVLPVDGGRRLA